MIRRIHHAGSLSGTVLLPGDKSISHRYALLAAISTGTSRINNFAASQDCQSTLSCLEKLGVEVDRTGDTVVIEGRGLRGLLRPGEMLDAGNSGTTIRLLSGVLAGQSGEYWITGDESLSRRPMGRIIEPLRQMGAGVDSRDGGLPPLKIRGGRLKALRYRLPVASAQVKSCVLLAGLYGDGVTAVEERIATRDHTEIALRMFGASLRSNGDWIEIEPGPPLQALTLDVPGDLSGAAFFLVAAALVPGSEIHLPGVGLNPRRRALLDYLQSAGLDIVVRNASECSGEARGDLLVRHRAELLESGLPPISAELVPALIDEIPALAILGVHVAGGLEISDAQELRVKESDRIAALAANLRCMGAQVEEKADGLRLPGGQHLRGGEIVTRGDHRIAMAFAVAGLAAQGETVLDNAECADVSFPGFYEALSGLSAR